MSGNSERRSLAIRQQPNVMFEAELQQLVARIVASPTSGYAVRAPVLFCPCIYGKRRFAELMIG
jgi:hypothetical protein